VTATRPRAAASSVRAPGPALPSRPSRPPSPWGHGMLARLVAGVLALGVVGTAGYVLHRTWTLDGIPESERREIPALQVAPAAIRLGTVGQPIVTATAVPRAAPTPRRPVAAAATPVESLAAWAAALAGPTGIPARALESYGMAELVMRRLDAGCHLSWVTVAGLARIESDHGRFAGSAVRPDGEVEPPITGVPLDGTGGNAAITDGAGAYATAMGPLQFIPSTWARWGVDTHGTGRADVENIDDAAVTAGRYLCAAGGDLATGPGWRAAVLAYNASDDYARRVYAAAAAYAGGRTA
jgi:hypothetical protein